MSTRLKVLATVLLLSQFSIFAETTARLTPASAPVRKTLSKQPARVPDDGREYTTVLEEDFSLCTAGAEHDPDKTFIENADYSIPASYTHTPGWKGRAIMQAGGAICIGFTKDPMSGTTMTGQIETPALDLHRDQGRAYLSFRARTLSGSADQLNVRWVAPGDPLPVSGEAQTAYIAGTAWQKIEVSLTDCPEDASIQIYSDNSEVLIDDIRLEQFHAEIDAPKALKWTDYTGDAFTANWTAVEGADHYVLNIFYIRRQGSEDQLPDYKYIVRDRDVNATSYRVENLDPDKVYYYYVRAVNAAGVLSEESQVVEVMALTVPDGITVSDVSARGFRASWAPVRNAEGYGFQALLRHTATSDEDYPLIDENFDVIVNEGSIGSPYVNTIGYYDMDEYGISRANWVLYEGGVINGAVCLRNHESSYGETYYGELVSPILSVGQSTGEIAIEADFATLDAGVRPYVQIAVTGQVDGQTTWVLGAGGEITDPVGKTWTRVRKTYKIKPGLVRFSIGVTDGGWLYMDNLRISVRIPEGAVQSLPYRYTEIKENLDAPQYYCATPDRADGDAYSFALMAARQKPGAYLIPVYVTSDWSELTPVPDPEPDGVAEIAGTGAGFSARALPGAIAIVNPEGTAVTVRDLSGRTVAATSATEATLSVAAGLYIVCPADGPALKLSVK